MATEPASIGRIARRRRRARAQRPPTGGGSRDALSSWALFPALFGLAGGPGTATEVTNYYAFVESFNFSYWGHGSAIATLMVAGVLLLSWMIGFLGGGAEPDE